MKLTPEQHKLLLKNDNETWRWLVELLSPCVFWLIFRLLGRQKIQRHTAEDLTQTVFLKVVENIRQFNPECAVKPWVSKIAVNTALSHLRKRKQPDQFAENEDGLQWEPQSREPTPEHVLMASELSQQLDQSLDDLPEDLRLVFILHVNLKWTFREIAEICEQSDNTISSRFYRAKVQLRDCLNTRLGRNP